MAYMNQTLKAALAPTIKKILKKYGLKGTLAVDNHSTLVLNIKSGKIDFGRDRIQVNHFHINSYFEGVAAKALSELKAAMNVGNHDNSRSEIDYFDIGWHININVGKWNKPYVLEK